MDAMDGLEYVAIVLAVEVQQGHVDGVPLCHSHSEAVYGRAGAIAKVPANVRPVVADHIAVARPSAVEHQLQHEETHIVFSCHRVMVGFKWAS